ncbi:hypothetical protein MAFF241648_21270 [Ralstonia solanacearum]|nr:hypothetical protein MAFF241648_21270 [Ralstonia solanacearum]
MSQCGGLTGEGWRWWTWERGCIYLPQYDCCEQEPHNEVEKRYKGDILPIDDLHVSYKRFFIVSGTPDCFDFTSILKHMPSPQKGLGNPLDVDVVDKMCREESGSA